MELYRILDFYKKHRMLIQISTFVLIALMLLVASYWAMTTLSYGSWIFIFFLFTVTALVYSFTLKQPFLKYVAIYSAALFAVFYVVEVYLEYMYRGMYITSTVQVTGECVQGGYYESHDYLGYGPAQEGSFSCSKWADDELVFDITYTLSGGQRITPNSNSESDDVALFFGCSFTYGEGLENDETIAAHFNEFADNRYRIKNYGFSGYGPHQMLANIERRVPVDIQSFDGDKIAIYTFIPDHLKRASGKTPWGRSGPQYVKVEDEIVYKGNFNFQSPEYKGSANKRRLLTALHGSRLYYQLFVAGKIKQKDLDLTAAMIKKSSDLLAEEGVQFFMVIWDMDQTPDAYGSQEAYEYFVSELEKAGIPLVFMTDFMKTGSYSDYVIHQVDAHPNSKAAEIIARSIFNKIRAGSETSFAVSEYQLD